MPQQWIECKGCKYFHRRQKCPAKCWCGTALLASKWEKNNTEPTLAEKIKNAAAEKIKADAAAAAAARSNVPTQDSAPKQLPTATAPVSFRSEETKLISAEITRLDKLTNSFTAEDATLRAQVEQQIAVHKQTIINSKPLNMQIQQLEELLQRKESKIAECDAMIMEAYSQKQELQLKHTQKTSELALLKQQAQETHSAMNMPSPDAQMVAQLSLMQQQMQQMMGLFSSLSAVQGLPQAAMDVLGQAIASLEVPATAVRAATDPFATPVRGTSAAPASPRYPSPAAATPLPPDSGRFGGPSPLQQPSSFGPATATMATLNARDNAAPYMEIHDTEVVNVEDQILQATLQQAAIAEAVASAQAATAESSGNMDTAADQPFSRNTEVVTVDS